ncbi:hypothetical protein U9M48_033337 [Paspalum notatum var. saurae]|uniref:Uncharacterized protein n=1 Tax=Paspalum notatum var. saurae TaxID=547442 RepID=A0AAQ3U700_PASNO
MGWKARSGLRGAIAGRPTGHNAFRYGSTADCDVVVGFKSLKIDEIRKGKKNNLYKRRNKDSSSSRQGPAISDRVVRGVLVRRRHDALVAVEVDPPRERPAPREGEVALVLLQNHLRLHVPVLQQHLVVVLYPPEHPRGAVLDERPVVEAEELRDALQVGVLQHQVPVAVVPHQVVVLHRHLHPPVLPVVNLHVPVHPDRAHVLGAMDDRRHRLVVVADRRQHPQLVIAETKTMRTHQGNVRVRVRHGRSRNLCDFRLRLLLALLA